MDFKMFYYWLDGYLTNKLEKETIELGPIIEKMSQVKDDLMTSKIERGVYYSPIRREDDDLGRPPRIIM